jgi:hypothetical protein
MWKYMIVLSVLLCSCGGYSQTMCPAWGSCSTEDVREISVELNKMN